LLSSVNWSLEKGGGRTPMEQNKNIKLWHVAQHLHLSPREQGQTAYSTNSTFALRFRRVRRNLPLTRAEACGHSVCCLKIIL
jgi:hypothetical protein